MKNKSGRLGFLLKNGPSYIFLTLISLFVMIPFLWMLTTSLKDETKIFMFPPQWWPDPIRWSNFADVFRFQPFHLYLFNSVYIGVLVTAGTCLFAAIAGYAFAKMDFPFKNAIFLILLSSMMIPTEVTAIPLFNWMSQLGLVDTHFPLIVPPMLGAGGIFGVFLMRQFFITVPKDLSEAAEIDGCNPWTTYWRIMFPLAKPSLATLSIFTFLHSWNEFFEPLIYLNSSKLFTLPLALSLFTDQSGTQWHLLMAASVMATVPLLLVFFIAQKKFIEGVAMTGLK
ncbi:sugar ABC transporter ATP-binding protein [Paenibacillus swuensis]|uniref:Sugar ABC transporter ATP-binding protein n=1 Tax=Paenibacillus swuensis TaxID=1178515 RepID=A0A172TMT1_9BACL|nr:carbohydrate ABC transporter permease [Paenibacillus swuensis]ANE48389.1 sugar ABC transporter ATP-binding protein [Paenibacillus swuensis]